MFDDIFVYDGTALTFDAGSLLTTATDCLLVAAAAGLVVFAIVWGVRKITSMIRGIGGR